MKSNSLLPDLKGYYKGKVIFSQASVNGGDLLRGGGPGGDTPRDGHCCGRYASYWNAFLFTVYLHPSETVWLALGVNVLYCVQVQDQDTCLERTVFVRSHLYYILFTLTPHDNYS